jgi:hypothetical protein
LFSVSNSPAASLRRRGSVTNRILLENYYLPGQLEQRIGEFVDYYNNQRYHENLDNLIPADVCFGRGKAILKWREKQQTKNYRGTAAAPSPTGGLNFKPDEPVPLLNHNDHCPNASKWAGKIARSALQAPFGLTNVTVAVRTSPLSCRKAGKL